MAPRTKAQFAQIRKNRKEAISMAAMQLFANNGFQNTTISQIAKTAGVSKGLLYNYFENKEALMKKIVLEGINEIMISLEIDFEQDLTRESLIKLLDKNFAQLRANTNIWKLYTAVITQPRVMELVQEELFAIVSPFIQAVNHYFEKKGAKNAKAYGFLIGAMMDGIGLDFMFNPEHYPLDAIRDIIVEKII